MTASEPGATNVVRETHHRRRGRAREVRSTARRISRGVANLIEELEDLREDAAAVSSDEPDTNAVESAGDDPTDPFTGRMMALRDALVGAGGHADDLREFADRISTSSPPPGSPHHARAWDDEKPLDVLFK